MLTEFFAEIRNYFVTSVHTGDFEIVDGTLAPLTFAKEGQCIRIVGSAFNDGVYQVPSSNLVDESFNGEIWVMAVPPAVMALAREIEEYNASDAAKASPYTSESFGNYSYSKATKGNGIAVSWREQFASRLNFWRKS